METRYTLELLNYRDLLEKRVTNGKMNTKKCNNLINKLNEWYYQAQRKGIID